MGIEWILLIIFGGLGLLVGLIVVLFVVGTYNSFVTKKHRIDNAWAQIDVQLKKRYDLVPNLVETVKGYATHEKTTFIQVTQARSAMNKAGTIAEKAKASNMLTDALKSLFAVVENYPDLKANKNFLLLQEELSGIENKIAYARQFYNDNVMSYNMKREKFPSSIIAGIGKFEKREYFEPPEGENLQKAPQVKF
ncbi:LemA family protein [archaeon]|nr:LemA family protein [archaeon]